MAEQNNQNQKAKRRQSINFGEMFAKVKMKVLFIVLGVVTAIYLFYQIYFSLIPFAWDSIDIRVGVIFLTFLWTIPFIIKYTLQYKEDGKHKQAIRHVHWAYMIPAVILLATILVSICLAIFTTPMFIAKDYNQMINVVEKVGTEENKYAEFQEEVADFAVADSDMQVAIIDKAFAQKLGEKVLGDTAGGYASQFAINNYTLSYYKGKLCWIGAIEPKGFFQWTSTSKEGSPGYVIVDATQTGDRAKADLVTTHKLKYTPGAYFGQDAGRKMYFGSMTSMRDATMNFELDDEGNPYFTQAIYKNKFGITSGKDIVGIMTLNAETGEVNKYDIEHAPAWLDRVMPSSVITKQLNYWGEYRHGYFNTWFAKKEVNNTTEGYSYVYNNGKLYYTTGISAKATDDALIGMVLTDTRTKDTVMYNMIGATEKAAMRSAEGLVQEKGYVATFPALVNFLGVPSYYIGLKDNEGLIKMYAYVSVENYADKLAVADTPEQAKIEYAKKLDLSDIPDFDGEEITLSDAQVYQYVSGGNTMFYIVSGGMTYTASVNVKGGLMLLPLNGTSGNTVKCVVKDGIIIEVLSVSKG